MVQNMILYKMFWKNICKFNMFVSLQKGVLYSHLHNYAR